MQEFICGIDLVEPPYRFFDIHSFIAILLAGHTFNHILNALLTLKPQISLYDMFVKEMFCFFV